MRKVTNSSVTFPALTVVRYRNVKLTTLNIALLRRQPKYCELPFPFDLTLFSIFSIIFGIISFWDFLLLFVFNVFVSFSRIPKGASTITKGFQCSLECERVKNSCFKNKKKNPCPYFLVRSSVGLYAAA